MEHHQIILQSYYEWRVNALLYVYRQHMGNLMGPVHYHEIYFEICVNEKAEFNAEILLMLVYRDDSRKLFRLTWRGAQLYQLIKGKTAPDNRRLLPMTETMTHILDNVWLEFWKEEIQYRKAHGLY